MIPIIGYDIFDPVTREHLNISYCIDSDINVTITIPNIIIDEDIIKYNPYHDFYKDNCYPSTSGHGTDILLDDRQAEFLSKKMYLCENDCSPPEYDENSRSVSCNCKIKSQQLSIIDLKLTDDILVFNFTKNQTSVNPFLCLKSLFSSRGLKKNIASSILIVINAFFIASIFIFIKFGYPSLLKEIEDMKFSRKRTLKYIHTLKESIIKNKNSKNEKSILYVDNRKLSERGIINNEDIDMRTVDKINLKEGELNLLSFKSAALLDKRGFCTYYFSLIKAKHPLLFYYYLNYFLNKNIYYDFLQKFYE